MVKRKQKLKGKVSSWEKIHFERNITLDDCPTFDGLSSLEVLDGYDKKLVIKTRKVKKPIPERQCEGDTSSEDSDDEGPRKKKKKTLANKTQPGKFVRNPLMPPESEENVDNIGNLSVEDLQGWNGFGIPEVILKAIAENNFVSPTEIQLLTIPSAIIGKRDILGAAETGSGKTLAFGIPILAGILELKQRSIASGVRKPKHLEIPKEIIENGENPAKKSKKKPIKNPLYALILTPTRELAVQVKDHLTAAAKYTGIKIAGIFGGLSAAKQERVLKSCPEIVVATPGRLWELFNEGNVHLNKMNNISFLVIDEADRMLEKGHFEELRSLITQLNSDESKKQSRQTFVFSATLSLVHDVPEYLQKKNIARKAKFTKLTSEIKIQNLINELGVVQPKIVDITKNNQIPESLTESRIICAMEEKDYYLYYFLLKHPGRTIVFCNSIESVKRLARVLAVLNCEILPLHAHMMQKQRLRNLERFRAHSNVALIATDVAARGLDIPDVQHVIHYQVPRTSENYVHRSGRTARANKEGITVLIMEPKEYRNYINLCKTLGKEEDLPEFPVAERILTAAKERVNLARDIDEIENKTRRSQNQKGWIKKTAEEMDIILDTDVDSNNEVSDEDNVQAIELSKTKSLLRTKRQQLLKQLNKPLFSKTFSFKYPTSTENPHNILLNSTSIEENAINTVKEVINDNRRRKKKLHLKK